MKAFVDCKVLPKLMLIINWTAWTNIVRVSGTGVDGNPLTWEMPRGETISDTAEAL